MPRVCGERNALRFGSFQISKWRISGSGSVAPDGTKLPEYRVATASMKRAKWSALGPEGFTSVPSGIGRPFAAHGGAL